jgi:hypothetical protein
MKRPGSRSSSSLGRADAGHRFISDNSDNSAGLNGDGDDVQDLGDALSGR